LKILSKESSALEAVAYGGPDGWDCDMSAYSSVIECFKDTLAKIDAKKIDLVIVALEEERICSARIC
jgi:hypothetical protein